MYEGNLHKTKSNANLTNPKVQTKCNPYCSYHPKYNSSTKESRSRASPQKTHQSDQQTTSSTAMATATAQSPAQLLYKLSSSRSVSRLSSFASRAVRFTSRRSCQHGQRTVRVQHAAVGTAASGRQTKKKSTYELQTLTTWLLQQEQAGAIDAELTIVLSSISMACKQIASLVQRAGISNLTGVQGAVNVQGEDQKKLDVVSNEVIYSSSYNYQQTLNKHEPEF